MVTTLFAEEHTALRDVVRRWVERDADAHAASWERDGGWPRESLAAVAAQGWLGTVLPEPLGGDPIAALAVWEELGRVRSAGVVHDLLAQAHAAAVLAELGAPRADAALAGEHIVVIAGAPSVKARPEGDAVVVSGRAAAVPNAAWADGVVAVAADGDGFALVVIPAGACVITPAANPFGRRAGHTADIEFPDVAVAEADVLLRGPSAMELLLVRQSRFRLDHAAATVAGAWRTWEDAREYALQREAFGRPIGRFQVNRHALADMAGALTAARSLVHDTVRRLTLGALEPGETAAVRLYADRVAVSASDRCLQLHGGYGYTMEYDVQRAWRDARHLLHDEGAADGLREEIARALEASR